MAEKICDTCKNQCRNIKAFKNGADKPYGYMCGNPKSKYYMGFTIGHDTCEAWEQRGVE